MRYLPLTEHDRLNMLRSIGVDKVDDLFSAIPEGVRNPELKLPHGLSESQIERVFHSKAHENINADQVDCFLGGGVYNHHVPASVDYLIQRGEFLTSYTPYQPEISQGTLQVLFEFQTQVCLLTGMEIANASMYDGSTACAEAILLANRVNQRQKVLVSSKLHPHYAEVSRTHAESVGISLIEAQQSWDEYLKDASICHDVSAIVIQVPDITGELLDYTALSAKCKEYGILLIVVVTEIVSLGLLPSPGSMGADIVVAEGQSLGNPMSFGGPHIGILATKQQFLRQLPGRIAGQTTDADGKRGWVLTLSTREQHIRREKATSNICTNSGLCALAFSIHLALLGENGFKRLAALNHHQATLLATRLQRIPGVKLLNHSFFNEFMIEFVSKNASDVVNEMLSFNILAGIPMKRLYPCGNFPYGNFNERQLLVAVTEAIADEAIEHYTQSLTKVLALTKVSE